MYDTTKPYKKQILELIKQTWITPHVRVDDGLCFRKNSHPDYVHTDGIGTKGFYHWKQRSFENAVIDALAMNLNDLASEFAIPYAVSDHLFLPNDDHKAILQIVELLTTKCKKRDVAIVGGETAVHNDMNGLELSLTMLGFVERPRLNRVMPGDVLVGIESNGLHSNGFSKVREVYGKEYKPDFIEPTHIYLEEILDLGRQFDIHGRINITGGAFRRLIDLMPNYSSIVISRTHKLKPQDIFFDLWERGVTDDEMYKTFNCGIGYVFSVDKLTANQILDQLRNFKCDIIGEVIDKVDIYDRPHRHSIKIESMFSDQTIEILDGKYGKFKTQKR